MEFNFLSNKVVTKFTSYDQLYIRHYRMIENSVEIDLYVLVCLEMQ